MTKPAEKPSITEQIAAEKNVTEHKAPYNPYWDDEKLKWYSFRPVVSDHNGLTPPVIHVQMNSAANALNVLAAGRATCLCAGCLSELRAFVSLHRPQPDLLENVRDDYLDHAPAMSLLHGRPVALNG